MIEKELFYKSADINFHVFDILKEEDVELLFKAYPDKEKLRSLLKSKLQIKTMNLPDKTTIEIFLLLTEFCIKNKITLLETCTIFKIISDTIDLFKRNYRKKEIYEFFKKSLLTYSMNRFASQIGILKKETYYAMTNFFVDVIYRRFHMLHYSLTSKIDIDIDSRETISYNLPKVEDLSEGTEILPRNAKILRQYFESRRPKTELEQKIEIVLEFERDKLDQKMDKIFAEQDAVFNEKIDELLKKKK